MSLAILMNDGITVRTPWGKLNIRSKEFNFNPRFNVNNPPISEDYHFVHETIDVLMKYSEWDKKWHIASITDKDDCSNKINLSTETLKEIHAQGKFRINLAIDHYFINKS